MCRGSRCWLKNGRGREVISEHLYNSIVENETRPAIIYSNVKTHKEGWPFRQIMSASGTATVNLARWIEIQLKLIATKHESYIRDTKSFLVYLEELNEKYAPFPAEAKLVSWDTKNFYPSCDTERCIEAVKWAIDLWGESYRLHEQSITEALTITMSSNNGEIGGHYFTQIDGTTIGGPESASVTDIFGGQFIDLIVKSGAQVPEEILG